MYLLPIQSTYFPFFKVYFGGCYKLQRIIQQTLVHHSLTLSVLMLAFLLTVFTLYNFGWRALLLAILV